MEVTPILKTKTVTHYTFTLTGGIHIPISIDISAGDSMTELPAAYLAVLAGKESLTDSSLRTPEEMVNIFKDHLLMVSVVTREVELLDPAKQEELRLFLKAMSKQTESH